jgi:hypothetical protein
MMNRPSTKRAFLLIVTGMLSAYLWLWLFGLWAIYDTPLLKLSLSIGLGASITTLISSSLFAFLTAALFTVPLRLFCRDSFPVSATIFVAAFLLAFLVSAFVGGQVASLFSFSTLWLFVLLFTACAFLATRFHHA